MAARTPPFALRTTAGLGLGLIAATLLLSGCGNTGVGVAASNRGAAVGVSVGTPNIDSSQRDKWPALPPPQLMTPEQIKAAKQEPEAPSGSTAPSKVTPKP